MNSAQIENKPPVSKARVGGRQRLNKCPTSSGDFRDLRYGSPHANHDRITTIRLECILSEKLLLFSCEEHSRGIAQHLVLVKPPIHQLLYMLVRILSPEPWIERSVDIDVVRNRPACRCLPGRETRVHPDAVYHQSIVTANIFS